MNGKVIAKKLHTIENGILGAINNPEIKAMMEKYGYTQQRLEEGRSLLDKSLKLMTVHVKRYSDQYIATDTVSKQQESAYASYMVVLKIVRVAFKGNVELLNRFNATGIRSKSLSGWLREARILYTNLLKSQEELAVMEKFGITPERLEKDLKAVNMVEELNSKQLEKIGEAQQSTLARDETFDALFNWYSDFRAIARIALYNKPQLLEVLGIVKK